MRPEPSRVPPRPDEASQVERAYLSIKAGIIDGRYRPGDPLSEPSLAAAHGMSRTPIREGLARLWQQGYLDRLPGRGYFVARVTVQSIHETFEVRRLLEGAAAARAAERATPEAVARLRAAALVPPTPNYRESEAANVRFHLEIAALAGNSLAAELIARCLEQVDRFMALGVAVRQFQEGASEAHLDIVAAIAAGDPARARATMEDHLDCGSRLMKEALLSVPSVVHV
jgi:GntR family transcriptional regulator, rspAB operon transcriptional repressor